MNQSKKSIILIVLLAISLIAPVIPQVQGAEGDYTGEHWDTSAQSDDSHGIATNGTHIWVVDQPDKEVYQYNMSGSYISSWDTSDQTISPAGITTDGVYIWIVAFFEHEVYKYNMSGSYISSWDTSAQTFSPQGITTDGTNIWVSDSGARKVFKYDMSGGYISFWETRDQTNEPYGVTTDGVYIWIAARSGSEVYKYNMSGSYISSWDTSDQTFGPHGITTDGVYIWIIAYTEKEVFKYEYLEIPSTPTILFGAGFNASSPYVELHWNHNMENVDFFEVQNSSDSSSWMYLGQSYTANYTDTQVVNGTERYYRVRACNQTDSMWVNSSWTDVNFEKVYFLPGDGAPVDDYSIIFLAIGLIMTLSVYFLTNRPR